MQGFSLNKTEVQGLGAVHKRHP